MSDVPAREDIRVLPSCDGYLPGLAPKQTGQTGLIVSSERWRAIYEAFLTSPAWQTKRAQVLERADGRCERCRNECTGLDVHHLTYDRFGGLELLTDLEALCGRCHPVADEERRGERDAAYALATEEAEESIRESAFASWMTEKRGEDWRLGDDAIIEEERTRFETWIERKHEREDCE